MSQSLRFVSVLVLCVAGCGGSLPSRSPPSMTVRDYQDPMPFLRAAGSCVPWFAADVVAVFCVSHALNTDKPRAITGRRLGVFSGDTVESSSGGSGLLQAGGRPLEMDESLKLQGETDVTGQLLVHAFTPDGLLVLARFDAVKLEPDARASVRFTRVRHRPALLLEGLDGGTRGADRQVLARAHSMADIEIRPARLGRVDCHAIGTELSVADPRGDVRAAEPPRDPTNLPFVDLLRASVAQSSTQLCLSFQTATAPRSSTAFGMTFHPGSEAGVKHADFFVSTVLSQGGARVRVGEPGQEHPDVLGRRGSLVATVEIDREGISVLIPRRALPRRFSYPVFAWRAGAGATRGTVGFRDCALETTVGAPTTTGNSAPAEEAAGPC